MEVILPYIASSSPIKTAANIDTVDYRMDGGGLYITGLSSTNSHLVTKNVISNADGTPSEWTHLKIRITEGSYTLPSTGGTPQWTDMRNIKLTFTPLPISQELDDNSKPESDGRYHVRLFRLCSTPTVVTDDSSSTTVVPTFCAIPSTDNYVSTCHTCNCKTCHNCGCSAAGFWDSCSRGSCAGDGGASCWCSPACKCCSDCSGTICNCEDCCENEELVGCSLGGVVLISGVSPENGVTVDSTDVVISGEGFWRSASEMKCRFSKSDTSVVTNDDDYVVTTARFIDVNSIGCTIPPVSSPLPTNVDYLDITVQVSMDGITYTPITSSSPRFTYVDCGSEGCTNTCMAVPCRCPIGTFGSVCQHTCTCVNGSCGSVTGECVCSLGFTGNDCDVLCPGLNEADKTVCSNDHGSCFYDEKKESATCQCFSSFWGSSCDGSCPVDSNGLVCSGNGGCNAVTGICICDVGHYGTSCSSSCPTKNDDANGASCDGHGICCTRQGASENYTPCENLSVGTCACEAGFLGKACEEKYCYENCFGHGVCTGGGK